MAFARSALVIACLVTVAASAQAASTSFETFPNLAPSWLGVANGGVAGVTSSNGVNYYIGADRVYEDIGGIAADRIRISSDGRYVSAQALASDGVTAQAALYDRTTQGWTTLGGLGAGGTGVSGAMSISPDGGVAVGYAAVVSGTKTINHATVFRNGSVIDLTPNATGESRALATSNDGQVVIGYTNVSTLNSVIWTWNAATGSYDSLTPKGTNLFTGATNIAVSVSRLSANGKWAVGDSVTAMGKNFGGFNSINQFYPATLIDTSTGQAVGIPFDHVLDTTSGNDIDASMKASVTGVSDNGTVVGQFNNVAGLGKTALVASDTFIYFQSTGQSYTFDSYLNMLGFGLTATQHVWTIYSMSADGNSLAGIYFDSAISKSIPFLVNTGGFIPSVVPEPGSWALLVLGLPFLVARRLRRKAHSGLPQFRAN